MVIDILSDKPSTSFGSHVQHVAGFQLERANCGGPGKPDFLSGTAIFVLFHKKILVSSEQGLDLGFEAGARGRGTYLQPFSALGRANSER